MCTSQQEYGPGSNSCDLVYLYLLTAKSTFWIMFGWVQSNHKGMNACNGFIPTPCTFCLQQRRSPRYTSPTQQCREK